MTGWRDLIRTVSGRLPSRPQKPRRRRRTGRGALWAIAVMFALSGILRLGDGAGAAIANGAATPDDGPSEPDRSSICDSPGDIAGVLALLREREDRATAREAALDDRMQALAVAETQIDRNMAALEEAEARLAATIALSATAAEDDLQRLTAVYENMKPKEAAPVFAAMDPQFAAGFLGRMRPDAAAAIMSRLEPETAYAISVLLAGRNAAAPTE